MSSYSHYDDNDMVIGNKTLHQKQQKKQINNLPGTKELRELEASEQAVLNKISLDQAKEMQRLRGLANLSQKDLNQRMNLPINTIANYESCKCTFNESLYKRIIRYLENCNKNNK
jgi:ribosome-binding protein aMBF1 (putative translation factor)